MMCFVKDEYGIVHSFALKGMRLNVTRLKAPVKLLMYEILS